jgi:hypothetical protein
MSPFMFLACTPELNLATSLDSRIHKSAARPLDRSNQRMVSNPSKNENQQT